MALGDLIAVAEARRGQRRRQPVVMPHVLGDPALVDEELRCDACAPLLLAGCDVDPPGVLLDNDAAVATAEPAQRLGREACPGQPLGQDPTIGSAATTRPDDLDFFVRQLLEADSVAPIGRVQLLLDDRQRPDAHIRTLRRAGRPTISPQVRPHVQAP